MKKMLLLLVCLTTFAWLHADEVTFDFMTNAYGVENTDGAGTPGANNDTYFANPTTATSSPVSIKFAKTSGNGWRFYNDGVRFYKGNASLTISANGATITAIKLAGATANSAFSSYTLNGGTSNTVTSADLNIECNTTEAVLAFSKTTSGGKAAFKTITVTYTPAGSPTQVSTPSITPTSGAVEAGTKVTISCSDTEAEIHYTTNGDDPTAESAIYTAETDITVNEAMTVKAIAVKEGLEDSKIATAEYTIKKTTAANIAEFISLIKTNPNEVFSIQTPVTAVYQKNLTTNNQNLYVTDGTDWLLVYGNVGKTYNNGDVIAAGIKGTAYDYSGTYELTNPDASTFADGVAGTPVEPAEVTSISADIVNHYVVVKGVTIGTPSSDNATATMADGTEIALYNKFQLNNFEAGSNLTVKGFVNVRNNTTIQLLPIEITNAAGEEIVAAPTFDPAPGAVEKGTPVTISCDTEGATIYYYLNDEDKGAYNGEAIEINEDTKIEAYAVKEGMSDSGVVEAQYTIKAEIPAANKASFDFTKMGLYDKDGNLLPTPTTGKGIELTNVENNHVIITFAKTGSEQAPRLWNSSGTIDMRLYSSNGDSNTMTIEATGGLKIESIEIAGKTVNTMTVDTGSYTGVKALSTWTPAVAKASSVEKVVFTATAGVNINTINVITSGVYDSVDDIIVDENAPVEYYNLQGVRVANPENGIYIRRQGSKVSKVLVK